MMDEEKERKSSKELLLEYPSQSFDTRQKFMMPKTIQELLKTSLEQIQNQFELLNSAQISQDLFNKNYLFLNRYRDILAYDHNRVKVESIPDYYINANEISSIVDQEIFAVFGQAPVRPFDTFWGAVYFKKIPIIFMLCTFVDPRRGRQAERYWPDVGKSVEFLSGLITLTNKQSVKKDCQVVQTILSIQGPNGVHNLTHFHWKGWFDLKKPVSQKTELLEEIIKTCLSFIEERKIIWIHCSAGIGRTGTLGGILEGLRAFRKDKKISIFQIVQNMRKQRFHAVQTLQQYKFLYTFLEKHLK